MSCDGGKRRIVTLRLDGTASEVYKFAAAPVADPLLSVAGAAGVRVDVDVSADGTAFAGVWGVELGTSGAAWRVPRSAKAIRVTASGGPATAGLAILEAAG